jgi:hypothetical protein
MNKIIVAIDGLKFSDSCFNYAIELALLTKSHLLGAFLEDFTYHSYKIQELVEEEGVSENKLHFLQEEDAIVRNEAIQKFETICQNAGVHYSLHRDRNIAIRELLHESIFGDLLVIDRKETLTHYEENIPTRFIKDLLANIQCPALITPETYRAIEKIIFLYDGDPSSVFAIKMFNYNIPTLNSIPVEVVSVNSENEKNHLPDNHMMKEFMNRHFPNTKYTLLKGNPEVEIISYLQHLKQNALVCLGAYQRGMVSRWFRQSMADVLMRETNSPLFIAHNKG